MDLYIDTANIDEIREAASLGVLDGVTTNPSLVAKEGVDFFERLEEICRVVSGHTDGVVSLESSAIADRHLVVHGGIYRPRGPRPMLRACASPHSDVGFP